MCIWEGTNEPAGWLLPWSPTKINQILSASVTTPTFLIHPVWSHRRHGTPLDIPLLHRPETAPDGRSGGIWHSAIPLFVGPKWRGDEIGGYRRIVLTRERQWLPDVRGLTSFGHLRKETYTNWTTTLRLSKHSLALQVVLKMLLQPETCWINCCHHGTCSVWMSLLLAPAFPWLHRLASKGGSQ